jgi:hypothetical protein
MRVIHKKDITKKFTFNVENDYFGPKDEDLELELNDGIYNVIDKSKENV